jgi:hypothetical protein
MKRLVKATVRGAFTAIGAVWFVLFPPDSDVPPSFYRQQTQDHSEYLPGVAGRAEFRFKHTWRPPISGMKPLVED